MIMEYQNLEYIIIFFAGAFSFLVIGSLVSNILIKKKPTLEKNSPYESGETPIIKVGVPFSLRYFIIALLFLFFELEIIFIFLWATLLGDGSSSQQANNQWGWFLWIEMAIFILVLLLALAYFYRKGALNWYKKYAEVDHFKTPVPNQLYEEINRKFASKK